MNNIEILIEKWEKEFDYYKEKLDNNKSETIDQLYMAHFEIRQIRVFIDDLKKLNLACVTQQSEQFLAFYKYMEPERSKDEFATKHAISAYLKANNCG